MKTKKRFLGLLLSLALLLGLMSGMCLTAYADEDNTDGTNVTGVTLNPSTAQTIEVGGGVAFTATVAPETATDKTVKWSIVGTETTAVKLYSDAECTTEVGSDATSTLVVYAKGESVGGATITVTSNADNTKTAICTVTVTNPTYTVTWVNYDGAVLETDTNVAEGTKPDFNGETPTKPNDAHYTYTFSGWAYDGTTYATDDALPAVTGDTEYVAQFEAATGLNGSTNWSGDITVDRTQTLGNVKVTADVTLTIPEGRTLTVDGGIDAGSHTLTVNGKGTLIVNGANGSDGNAGSAGKPATNGSAGSSATSGGAGNPGSAGSAGFTGNIIVDGANVTVTGGTGGNGGIGGNGGNGGFTVVTQNNNGNTGGNGGNGGAGGYGVFGNITVKSGTITATGGAGGNGGKGGNGGNGGCSFSDGGKGGNGGTGGNGGNGGQGVYGSVDVRGGNAGVITGGSGGSGGGAGTGGVGQKAAYSNNQGSSGSNGGSGSGGNTAKAVGGNISGTVRQHSGTGSNWSNMDGDTSSLRYVKVHTHVFAYTLNEQGHVITATCSEANCTLTDKKATLKIEAPTLTTYGPTGEGISQEATITGSIEGVTNPSIIYTKGSEMLDSAPTDAGTYTASITLGGGDAAKTASVEYTIAQRPVKVSDITAEDKIYDGTTDATLVTTGATLNGKLDTDDLTVTATGTFDSANVGENKTVTISNLALDGTSKDNYTLAAEDQQTETKATITAKEIGIEWSNTVPTYNGEAQKPIATATGLVEGDSCTITVIGEQTNAGDDYTATAYSLSNDNYKLPENKTTTFKINKADPMDSSREVTKKALPYTGDSQQLVTPGAVEGGTLYYALGTDSETPPEGWNKNSPASNWSTDVPTGKDPGTYYVWYMVKGDANHKDVDPACIVVTIAEPEPEEPTPETPAAVAPVPAEPAQPQSDYTLLMSMKASGKTALKLAWTRVPDAEGYDIFFGRCGGGACAYKATAYGNSYKIKGLKKGTAYKAYVMAWKTVNGNKAYIGEPSPDAHAIAGGRSNKYTNPKKISVKKKKLTLSVGKGATIKATLKKLSDSRRYLGHTPKVRYYSSNRNVATVDAKGKVTAVAAGTCTVYALSENGLRVGVKVTVK